MKNINSPLTLDPYKTRGHKLKFLNKKESIYAGMVVSYLAVLLFVIIDFSCLNSSWVSVQNDNEFLIYILTCGCAVALDVPPAIAAIALKEGAQKLRGKRETMMIVALSVLCFLVVFAFQLGFRMTTKDATFSENASTIVNTLDTATSEQPTESGETVFYAALFSGVLPFCTSLASFVITYFGCDPLGLKIYRRDHVILQDDANIIDLKEILSEAEVIKKHAEFLVAFENDSLEAHIAEIKAQGELIKQVIRVEIMKQLENLRQVSIIQASGEDLNARTPDPSPPEESQIQLFKTEMEES